MAAFLASDRSRSEQRRVAGCTGDGFSPRAEDAVLHGCVPVVVMDDVDPVFSSVLDWSAFSIRVPEVGPHVTHCAAAYTSDAFDNSSLQCGHGQ